MGKNETSKMSPEEIDKLVVDTIKRYCVDTIYFKDLDSKFIWNSQEHADQVGAKSPEEMFGKSDYDYFPKEFADSARKTEEEIISTGKALINIEEEWDRGEEESMYFLASKYPFYNSNNEIIGTWGISKDITDLKRLEKEVERSYQRAQRLARVDDLTGLYNRRYFYENLERTCGIYDARADETVFSLIALDVDNIKYINDQYGQQHGDDVLRHVASAMLNSTRKTDICFRIGGDEFAVLLADCDKTGAVNVAKKIAENVSSQAVPVGDEKFEKVTVSLGVSTYDKGADMSEIISAADRKLYKSKRNGKNQISF